MGVRSKRAAATALVLLLGIAASPFAAAQQAEAPAQLEQTALDAAAAPAAAGKKLSDQLLRTYLTNDQLSAWMDEYVARCGHMARKMSVGKSAAGTDMWALEVSDKPGVTEAEPKFKYVANMHGDETSGRMLLPMFAEWLCANDGKDKRATRLVREAHIVLVPTMNPDGYSRRWRYNSHGVDLNRNFPDPWINKGWDLRVPLPESEAEVRAMMKFTLDNGPFTASANMHEGAVVVNYPYDAYENRNQRYGPHLSPDDETFKFLSQLYSDKHGFMSRSPEFAGGITNGADWYEITGGMQDWNYMAAGCMETTLELSQMKFPSASQLPALWDQNRDALISYALAASLGGVRGTVTAADGGKPIAATMYVKNDKGRAPVPFYASTTHGFYARPLTAGTHTVVATAPGYAPAEVVVTVPEDGSGVVANFSLTKGRGRANLGKHA